ncbi:MAG: chromate transporter [Chloroflexota bacterium]
MPSLIIGLFTTFFRIGMFSFGGGYAMLPLISREIVDRWHWLTPDQFVDVVAISGVTPGPIAVNAATFVGKKVAGVWGSAAATFGVVLPSFLIMLLLSYLMKRYSRLPVIQNMFKGIRPVVVALIASAAVFMIESSLTLVSQGLIAAAALVLALKTKIDPIIVLVAAGAVGVLLYGL